uniref:Uncharacterized protein n=1 Tax=Trichogramma kaykai TaxID=54128 RepID=A0ABD2VXL8_9HYME
MKNSFPTLGKKKRNPRGICVYARTRHACVSCEERHRLRTRLITSIARRPPPPPPQCLALNSLVYRVHANIMLGKWITTIIPTRFIYNVERKNKNVCAPL